MEIFLLLVLIVLVFWVNSRVSHGHQALQNRLDLLRDEIKNLKAQLKSPPSGTAPPLEQPLRSETPAPVVPIAPLVPPVAEQPELRPELRPALRREPRPKPLERELLEERKVAASAVSPPVQPLPPRREPQPSFLETFLMNNPDLEKFIGENLINKIGIAILVLGIGYFVKYAIDQEWINEIGRVMIGILAGGVLIGVAHRLRRSFSAFSSVLVGGGLAVLYFTIAIAFHEYQLFSQTAAFLVMVLITGFSILLSLSYNRIELAVLSLVGGFSTPFMLSTGEGNYQVLFSYILILNVGMLVLAYFKKWNLVNIIAYIFTVLLYGGWLSARVLDAKDAPYTGALVFGTLFYLVFLLMNIINNVKEKTRFKASEITILLSNTFAYYSAGMSILAHIQGGLYQGIFTVAVALINFVFAFGLYRNRQVDRNLIYLLIGLVITFISLAVPVQLEGNYITMFWALEAVLLLWFAQQSGLKLVSVSSLVVTVLMLISLVMDWTQVYGADQTARPLTIVLNRGFITSALVVGSLLATLRLLRRQDEPFELWWLRMPIAPYRTALNLVLVVGVYLSLLLEYNYQLNVYVASDAGRTILLGCYNLLFILGLMQYAARIPGEMVTNARLLLGMFGVLVYVLFYNGPVMQLLRSRYLVAEESLIGFPFHYLNLLWVGLLMAAMVKAWPTLRSWPAPLPKVLPWLMCVAGVYIISSELFAHVVYFNFSGTDSTALQTPAGKMLVAERFGKLLTQINKVGLPILWGICAFALIFIGLNRKSKDLRIISLSLFTLTLLKLFLYDIRGISEGGKIAAFISLGVLLLVISFMYQNIKKLILNDDVTPPTQL